jgi:hypothetical protein
MKPSPDLEGDKIGEKVTQAVYFFLLILGTVSLYSLLDNPIFPSDILICLIVLTFLVAVIGIKNTNTG